MKQYHYSDGSKSYGPFTLEELRTKNITPETLVWTEELVTWTKAKDIYELQSLLSYRTDSPPPIYTDSTSPQQPLPSQGFSPQSNYQQMPYQRPPKTYLVESILTTIFCCWPVGIPSIIYASRVEKKFALGDIEGAEADSANAKKWLFINIGVCAVLWVGYIAIFGLAMFAAI